MSLLNWRQVSGLAFVGALALGFQNCGSAFQSDRGVSEINVSSTGGSPSPVPSPSPGALPGPTPGPLPAPAPQPGPVVLQQLWRPLTQVNAPSARRCHAAADMGGKMFVWGGGTGAGFYDWSNEGAIFNAATGIWTAVSPIGAPSARTCVRAVWTGSKIIVWGGYDLLGVANTGGIYDPSTDTWAPMLQLNSIPGRYFHSMAWMNGKLFVWGGIVTPGFSNGQTNEGFIYDPNTYMWTPISLVNAPPAMESIDAIYVNGKILIFGGFPYTNTLYQYDPAANSWSLIATVGAPPSPRCGYSAVWTGKELLIFGGTGPVAILDSVVGSYNPADKTWRKITAPAGLVHRNYHSALWTGVSMIVWGGFAQGLGGNLTNFTPLNTGDVFY